jgi:tetratricopeptide (TPR) repeat protein
LFLGELCLLDPRIANSLLPSGAEPSGSGWLASLVAARAQQLPADAKRVLETAAVVGMAPPRWLLDALLGETVVATALPLLQDQDFLLRGAGPAELAFKHGITWEIIYSLVPLTTRTGLHAAIAAEIEARADTPDIDRHEALAWHYQASMQPIESLPHCEKAGDNALKVGSIDRAQARYRQAIETSGRLPATQFDPKRHTALVSKYGFACIFDSDPAQFPVFEDAIRRAEARGDRLAQAQAEHWLGYVAFGSGFIRLAIRHSEAALALSGTETMGPMQTQALATLGAAHAFAADYAKAVSLLDRAIAAKRAHRSGRNVSAGLAYALAQRACVHADTGDFAAARALLAEAQALLLGEAHPVEASVLGLKSIVCGWQGDWDGMLAASLRGSDVALQSETVYLSASNRALENYARWKLEGTDAAARALRAACECMADRGKYLSLAIACGYLAEVEAGRGNQALARWAIGQAFVRARHSDPLGLAAAARAWAASTTEGGLRAMGLAVFEAMQPDTAAAFGAYVQRQLSTRAFGPIFAEAAAEYRAERDRRAAQ